MTMTWRLGTSHHLPDALTRLPRPDAADDLIDDSFPDNASSGNPTDCVGLRGPIRDGQLLSVLELFEVGW